MKCLIVGKIVSCLLTAPAPSPADAAKILAPGQYVYHAPLPEGPKVVYLWGDSSSGPFGSFPGYPVQRPLNCCSVYMHPGVFGRGLRGISR